jgi:hypothetical protein
MSKVRDVAADGLAVDPPAAESADAPRVPVEA